MRRFIIAIFLCVTTTAFAAEETKSLKWNGDFRYRYEQVMLDGAPSAYPVTNYSQQRIRARLGLLAPISKDVDFELRLTTGTGRTSTNQTLSNTFGNYAIGLDRAYVNWYGVEGLNVLAGRVKNSYYIPGGAAPGSDDVLWSSDINFDGVAATYAAAVGNLTPFANATAYTVYNPTTTKNQSINYLLSLQAGTKYKINDDMKASAGIGMYRYTNAQGQAAFSGANGNTTVGGNYIYDYHLIDVGGDLECKLLDQPIMVFGDYITNTAEGVVEKTAYIVGLKYGQSKKSGDWWVGYDYRKVGADSMIGSFNDANSFGGGTNGRSHRVFAGYNLTDAAALGLTGYIGKVGIAGGADGDKRNRVQADVSFKF